LEIKVHYIVPYSIEKNFGKAINEQIALIHDSDWVCVLDGDCMFLTAKWGHHIQDIVNNNQNHFSLFGCLTNRLGRPIQRYKGEFSTNFDIKYHSDIAHEIESNHWGEVEDITSKRRIAGMFMLFPKSLWNRIKFTENTPNFDDIFSTDVLRIGGKCGCELSLKARQNIKPCSKWKLKT